MDEYEVSTYGDRIADVYDEWYTRRMDPNVAVTLLAELAGLGRALELGGWFVLNAFVPDLGR